MEWLEWLGRGMAPLDIVSAFGTVIAAGLAAWALQQSGKASERALDALRVERRLDFELDLLMELADLHRQTAGTAMRSQRIQTRLQLLPRDEFTVANGLYRGLHVGDEHAKRWKSLHGQDSISMPDRMFPDSGLTVDEEIAQEFKDGITARLRERPEPGPP